MMIEHFPLKLCGGLIYSGHTCYFTLCAELWRRYSTSKFMVPAIWSTAAVGLYVLVSCRYHYTVDIILALAIALMACVLYHGQVRLLMPSFVLTLEVGRCRVVLSEVEDSFFTPSPLPVVRT